MDSYQSQASSVAPLRDGRASRRNSGWAMWIASTLAAAGLAFYIGWWFAGLGASSNQDSLANSSATKSSVLAEADNTKPLEGAEELIGLWSESQGLLAVLGPGMTSEYASEASEEYSNPDSTESDEDAFAWMLAAVSASTGELPQDAPEVMEN